ncbi:MAG: dihydroorotase [bacterium]|nr:dihydroorotase [bacterium]
MLKNDLPNWEIFRNKDVLLKNVKIIDPYQFEKEINADILIQNGKYEKIASPNTLSFNPAMKVVENISISPGWFDLHVHLREPGFEHKETIETGLNAAMAGGFTGVACMPNTNPALDNAAVIQSLLEKASGHPVFLSIVAAATKNRAGKELTELAELAELGIRAVSDDGSPVVDSGLVRKIMEYGSMFGITFFSHAEDPNLSGRGVMNEGIWSTTLGLNGIPTIAEDVMVSRDILIAEYTKCPVHICHVSSAKSVELIREAKSRGIQVTCEATPHHFSKSLTDSSLVTFSTNLKMNPPLRSMFDVEAIQKGLQDSTIDCIATDHAPHSIEEKEVEFDYAAFGITGLETCFGVAYSELVHKGVLTIQQLIEKLSINPRKIMKLPPIPIKEGNIANITLFDEKKVWRFEKNQTLSKSINSPFYGKEFIGKPLGILREHFFCYCNN